jgi:hypothetical protein
MFWPTHAPVFREAITTLFNKRLEAKAAGNKAIDAYEATAARPPAEQLAAMEAAIRSVGPEKVSRHCADPAKLGVIDIAPSSLVDGPAFFRAAQADPGVAKVLGPQQSDPAYHLEIPQPAGR